MIAVELPGLRTESKDNARGHWARKARKTAKERHLVSLVLGARRAWRFPVRVTITRIAPRRLDTGGLWSAMKAVQDEVAKWLGGDDGASERAGQVQWVVEDKHGGVRVVAVRIRIEEVADARAE